MLTKISSFTKSLFTIRRGFLPLAFIVCLLGVGGFAAYPIYSSRLEIFTVTNTNDSGAGSLRQAILDANATVADDTITFNLPDCPNGVCAITLTSGELAINAVSTAGRLTITNSTGASNLLISGNNASRVFFLRSGADAAINGITITGGNGTGTTNTGFNGFGGGFFNENSNVTITNTVFSSNKANINGGSIQNSLGGTTTIADSIISGNSAVSQFGGAIAIGSGTLTIINSTVSGNTANTHAGGIYNNGTLNLINATVTANRRVSSGSCSACGGGIYNNGTVNLLNTIIAGNSVAGATGSPDFYGAVSSTSSFNIIGNNQGMTGITNGTNNNQVGTNTSPIDARLAPLGDYGGSTQTHALLSNSPAINAGSDCVINLTCPSNNPPDALTTDQRGAGFPRKVGSAVDIGAFEVQLASTAATYVVTTNTDPDNTQGACAASGACSLRQAINTANAIAGDDTINFAAGLSGQTILLTQALGQLTITSNVTIDAMAVTNVSVSGGGVSRVFLIDVGSTVVMSGFRITGGGTTSLARNGAGIGNNGDLTLNSMIIQANNAGSDGSGGGISSFGDSVRLTINNSSILGNSAGGSGGGIRSAGGSITLTNVTVSGNTAQGGRFEFDGFGGGISTFGSVTTITNSTISNNTAQRGGGGIYFEGGTSNISIFGTTLSGNSAGSGLVSNGFRGAGGILNERATVNISNSTVSGNSSGCDCGGGGITSFGGGTTNLRNVTVANNAATAGPGGGLNSIVTGFPSGTINIGNTIVANNTASGNSDVNGAITSQGFNLVRTRGTSSGYVATDLPDGSNPMLEALGNNGGSTQTHRLLAGSTAIDTGSNALAVNPSNNTALTTDQRGAGFPRIRDGNGDSTATVDIGAFEVQTTPASLSLLVTRSDNRNNATCVAGDCTLREAVNAANASATNDTISFAVGITTITLTNEIVITNNGTLSINGGGANVLTIDGGAGTNRIFSVLAANVTIMGVTLTGGNGAGSNSNGFGNAILVDGGTLVLESVVVRANIGTGTGGAVFYFRRGTNHRISNSTFSDNRDVGCAGFRIESGTLAVINSTISGNQTTNAGGGGFCVFGGDVTMRNSTVTGNSASGEGGGIIVCECNSNGVTFNLGNTIVAGNTSSDGISPEIDFGQGFGGGTFTSAGYNLIGDSAGDSTNTGTAITYQATDIQNMNPTLGALTIANGGTTPTRALLAGSPAIDAGFNALADSAGLATDQRGAGFPRIRDGNGDSTATVDIGAYEYQSNNGGSNTPIGSSVVVQSAANDATVTFTQVGNAGTTTFTPINPPSSAGTPPPQGYTILDSEPAYDITTRASYTPPVTVCFRISSINDQAEFARVRILHGEGGKLVDRTILPPDSPAPDFATRTVCARVNSLSPFVVALAPRASTAASVSVGGRVMTMNGKGIRDVVVTMTGSTGNVRTTTTNESGYYRFADVEVGETYILSVRGKRYNFNQASQVMNINEETKDINFIGYSQKGVR